MDQFRVSETNFRLADYNPDDTQGLDERQCSEIIERNRKQIAELQNVLYAEKKQALLVILQSMDTAGKDPIIRDVLDLATPRRAGSRISRRPKARKRGTTIFGASTTPFRPRERSGSSTGRIMTSRCGTMRTGN